MSKNKLYKKFIKTPLRYSILIMGKKILLSLIILIFLGILLIAAFYYYFLKDLPSPTKLSSSTGSYSTQIYDRNNTRLYTIYSDRNQTFIPLSKIPRDIQYATIAIEDKDFYKATANGTTASSGPGPTCTGTINVTTCADNTMTWTFEGTIPGAAPWRDEHSNIYAFKSSGNALNCGSACYMRDSPATTAPPLVYSSNNLYSMSGNNLTYFTNVTSMATWKATTVANSALAEAGTLYGSSAGADAPGIVPNFIDPFGVGNFQFGATQSGPGTATACSGKGPNGSAPGVSPACGLGFVPWDYNDVGAR